MIFDQNFSAVELGRNHKENDMLILAKYEGNPSIRTQNISSQIL